LFQNTLGERERGVVATCNLESQPCFFSLEIKGNEEVDLTIGVMDPAGAGAGNRPLTNLTFLCVVVEKLKRIINGWEGTTKGDSFGFRWWIEYGPFVVVDFTPLSSPNQLNQRKSIAGKLLDVSCFVWGIMLGQCFLICCVLFQFGHSYVAVIFFTHKYIYELGVVWPSTRVPFFLIYILYNFTMTCL